MFFFKSIPIKIEDRTPDNDVAKARPICPKVLNKARFKIMLNDIVIRTFFKISFCFFCAAKALEPISLKA